MPLPSPQANNTAKFADGGGIFPPGGALPRPYINGTSNGNLSVVAQGGNG